MICKVLENKLNNQILRKFHKIINTTFSTPFAYNFFWLSIIYKYFSKVFFLTPNTSTYTLKNLDHINRATMQTGVITKTAPFLTSFTVYNRNGTQL